MSLHPDYPIGGCDVSYWQGLINFDKLLDKDIWFMIARASVGSLADRRYQEYKSGAIAAGLPFGAYHYWMPSQTVAKNCDALKTAQPARPSMGVYLDLEGKGFTITMKALSEHIYQCLQILDDYYKSYTGIYTRAEWWNTWIDDDYYSLMQLDKRPLWVAQYFYELQPAPTRIPNGWSYPKLWQYSAEAGPYAGQGSEFGVSSVSLDIDAWLGTVEEFHKFTSAIVIPPEPPPPEVEVMQVKTKSVCNVRNAPNLTVSSDVGNFDAGKVLDVIQDIDQFYKVEIYVSKSVVEPVLPPPPVVPEYYVCHDTEYQAQWRGLKAGVPEVFHFDQDAPTKLTEAWQRFIMALNPGMPDIQWRSLARWDRAFTNGTGYGNPNGNLYADFINGKDLNSPFPVNDKCRCCGGAILRGIRNGDILTLETLDGSKPPPPLDWVLARPWLYFKAITIAPDGRNYNFPQRGGAPVYWPLVATGPVTVKINTIIPAKPYPLVKAK